jgi:hypothetical protein
MTRVLCLALFLCGVLSSSAARADDGGASAVASGPVVVRVGLLLLSVGKLDVASGTYTADFYVSLRADRDMGDPRIELMNGRAVSVDVIMDTPREKQLRMQANLVANVDIRRFPWDRHALPITFESFTRTDKDLVFVVDEQRQGVDPSVVLVGWRLDGVDGVVSSHAYPMYGETYSQFTTHVKISRILLTASLKTFLPVVVFILIAFISLVVGIEKLDSRVSMNTAMLIASVMFHLAITNQLPPAAYLTVADKVLVATYATIGLLLSVLMMRHVQAGRSDAATRLRAASFTIVPGFAVVAMMVAVIAP